MDIKDIFNQGVFKRGRFIEYQESTFQTEEEVIKSLPTKKKRVRKTKALKGVSGFSIVNPDEQKNNSRSNGVKYWILFSALSEAITNFKQ